MAQFRILVQSEDFNMADEYQFIMNSQNQVGAIVPFVGLVRDLDDQQRKLDHLFLDYFPMMTQTILAQLAHDASQRWTLEHVTIIHRVGKLYPKDQIVLVMTSSSHRQSAFDATQFLIDQLKTRAPFWKKEVLLNGESNWLDPKQTDLNKSEYQVLVNYGYKN